MKKLLKRALSITLVFILVLLILPATAGMTGRNEAYAAEPFALVSHDPDEIWAYLQTDGDVTITLDDDVSQEFDGIYNREYWCTLGRGVKTFDLAGHTFEICPRWADGKQRWLFAVTSSETTFIVNDSSAKRTGKIVFDAMMPWLTRGSAGLHKSDYYPDRVQYRHIVLVRDGSFIFNGGTIAAGRRKSIYLGFGINAKDLWEYLKKGHTLSLRYDGDVTTAINSVGITIENGNVLINGGTVEGRGYRLLETGGPENNYYNQFIQAAAIRATSGRLVINNGTIAGYTAAHALDISGPTAVTILSGQFSTTKSGRVAVPHPSNEMFGGENNLYDSMYGGGEYGSHAPLFISAQEGLTGLKVSYLDPDMVDLVHDGDTIDESLWQGTLDIKMKDDYTIVPKDDKRFDLYNETYEETVEKKVVWDGSSDVIISADIIPYWPEDEIPYNQTKGKGHIHFIGALAQSSKDLGVTSAISIGGMTVSSGGEQTTIEKTLSQSKIISPDSSKLSFNLKDLLPDGLGMGDSFLVAVKWSDVLYDSENGPAYAITYKASFTVQLRENDLEIIQHPTGTSVTESGETVTLTAKAENASKAWWEKIYPSSEAVPEGSFDASTGVASLEVSVSEYAEYVCCFSNSMGIKKTDKASVSVIPAPNLAEDETREIVWSSKSDTVYLIAGSGATSGKIDQRWYYRENESDEWAQIEKVDGKTNPNLYSNTLAVNNPTAEDDAGYYRMEADYQTGDGVVTVKTGIYHVTVTDGFTDKTVVTNTSNPLMVYGMPELYKGDLAPSGEEMVSMLHTDDDRVSITQFKWNEADLTDGRFNTTAPRFTLTIAAKVSESCKIYYDSQGRFFVGIEDKLYCAYSETVQDDTSMGAVVNRNVVQGIVSGEASWYTATVMDRVSMENSYSVTVGEEVDIQLEPAVICHKRHEEAGVLHDTVDNFELDDAGDPEYRLPDGLTLSADGRITGTVTEEPSVDPTFIYVSVHIADNDEDNWKIPVRFYVYPVIKTMSLPVKMSELHHEHVYGEWTDIGDGESHMHICEGCGNEESRPHVWDEGVETPATGTAAGVVTYTCQFCGAVKTEEIEAHNIIMTEEIPATCIEEGVIAHYECEDCGMPFEDAEGTIPVTDTAELRLPLGDHDWDEWAENDADTHIRTCKVCEEEETEDHKWDEGKVTKESTTSEDGVFTYTCEVCGAEKTESIPKKVTITYDVGEGVKGEDWVDTFDVDYGYVLEAGKVIPPPENLMTAAEGMEFAGVDRDGTVYMLGDDAPELEITKDITIKYLWSSIPFEYTIVSEASKDGTAGKWIKGSGVDYEIVIKRSILDEKCFDYFVSLNLEDKTLVKDADYTAKAGSTVLTLRSDMLEKLDPGKYDTTIVFKDAEVKTTLTVEEASASEEPETPATPEIPEPVNPEEAPPTGDNSSLMLWAALFTAAAAALAAAVFADRKRRAR